MYFSDWVSDDVVCSAGFNHHQPSYGIQKEGKYYNVHIGQIGADKLNIIVIEGIRYRKDGQRKEWFFGTYNGKRPGEFTCDEYKTTCDKIEKMIAGKNKVPGYLLEPYIKKALENYFKK